MAAARSANYPIDSLSSQFANGMISLMTKDILISASILSADFSHLGEAIKQAENGGVDWIHVDVMDGHFVPNLTMGPVVLEACRRSTGLPLDVHLMVDNPDRLLSDFAKAGATSLTVHVEACQHLHRTIQAIHQLGCQAGVALNPATPLSSVQNVIGMIDLLLIMTVNPGYSGQSFIPESIEKIREARQLLDSAGSRAHLQVDGGIGPQTAPEVVGAGADVLAAASAIFLHAEGIAAGIRSLRRSIEGSDV